MFYELKQKVSECYVKVKVPKELKRGCKNSEFQFLNRKELVIELEDFYGSEFPDLLMAENYVPLISDKLKRMFHSWGIDNLYYKKLILKMTDYEIEENYWLALPPRIDCLDPEKAFDREFSTCIRLAIIPNRVGNYDIFKLKDGNDEIIITERLKKLIDSECASKNLEGIITKEIGK